MKTLILKTLGSGEDYALYDEDELARFHFDDSRGLPWGDGNMNFEDEYVTELTGCTNHS